MPRPKKFRVRFSTDGQKLIEHDGVTALVNGSLDVVIDVPADAEITTAIALARMLVSQVCSTDREGVRAVAPVFNLLGVEGAKVDA